MLDAKDTNIGRETDYIVGRAQQHAAHFVWLGPLVLFSTETGDAWMLDPGDGTALCLARDGVKQDYRVTDTPDQFFVEWNADYRIEGDLFVVAERSGRIRSIAGYPVEAILEAIRRAKVPAGVANVTPAPEPRGDGWQAGTAEVAGIPDIPAAEPLLAQIEDETPPEAGILKLAEAIKADPAVAERCLALFDAEVESGPEAPGLGRLRAGPGRRPEGLRALPGNPAGLRRGRGRGRGRGVVPARALPDGARLPAALRGKRPARGRALPNPRRGLGEALRDLE
jgi:hypothetical protein